MTPVNNSSKNCYVQIRYSFLIIFAADFEKCIFVVIRNLLTFFDVVMRKAAGKIVFTARQQDIQQNVNKH